MVKPKIKGARIQLALPLDVDGIVRSRAKREGITVAKLIEDQMCINFTPRPDRWVNPVVSRPEDFVTIKPACTHPHHKPTPYGLSKCEDCGARRDSKGTWTPAV